MSHRSEASALREKLGCPIHNKVLHKEVGRGELDYEVYVRTHLFSLISVDACTSRLREVEWYTEALAALGFADIGVIPGPFDVVVATRA